MKQRSLWPREHGAYVQLLAPLAAALRPSGMVLAAGAIAAFLAHEPWLVMRGARGRRAQLEHGARARRRFAACLAIAGGCGVVGLALAPEAIVTAFSVALVGAIVVILSWRGDAHTLGGELAAAVALSGAAAPVAIAGGASGPAAITIWAMWSLGFAATVIAVHTVVAKRKRWALWSALFAASGLGLALGHLAIGAPLWIAALAVIVLHPRAKHLRAIGIAFAAIACVTTVGVAL